jgi:hypothetical protein
MYIVADDAPEMAAGKQESHPRARGGDDRIAHIRQVHGEDQRDEPVGNRHGRRRQI